MVFGYGLRPLSLTGLFGLVASCHVCVAAEVSAASKGFSMLQLEGTAMSPLLLQEEADVAGKVESEHAPGARHVYIDMGANWANTLRLYEDIVPRADFHGKWEIYAFEAHPLIQPYLEKFVTYLNAEGEQPALTVPPSGSTRHLQQYAFRYGCFMRSAEEQRACLIHAFKYQLNALRANPELNSTALVKERLAVAGKPLASDARKNRFTFIPAAVGSQDGWLHFRSTDPVKSIFGGAVSDGRSTDQEADIIAVDAVAWMVENFKEEDFVLLKMDVEGAEFGILHALYAAKKLHLIDVLAYECHTWVQDGPPPMQNCENMTYVLSHEHLKTLVEGEGYEQYDKRSTPELYHPVDPIIRGL